jgi:predicted porin
MKRHLLTLAIAATLLPLAAQAAPRVYGQLNLSVDYMDADVTPSADVWELNSNSSRVGVKGAEKLTEEYTAVYKMEWAVNGDMGGADLNARERYIGIKHYQWGTVRLGFIDAPFKNAEDDIDAFNDLTHLDMDNFLTGQNRLNNSINYVSPKFLDVFGANITMQPGEQTRSVSENHLADGYSAAFSYEDDSLYLSYAMDKDITSEVPGVIVGVATVMGALPPATTSYSEARDAMRFNVRYKMNDLTLSAMLQKSEASNNLNTFADKLDEDAIVLSGSYKMDAITLRGQVSKVKFDAGKNFVGAGNDEVDTTLIGLGADYNMTENTKLFGNLAVVKNEITIGGASADVDVTILSVGTEVRF